MDESPIITATPEPRTKPKKVIKACNAIIRWTLVLLTLLTPLFFLPWTNEVTELNKQLLIFVGAVVAGLAWFGKMLAERRFEYRRTIVNAIVLLYAGVYAASTWLSVNTNLSLMGDFGQEQAGLLTILSFVMLYFVAINNITTVKMLKKVMGALILSGFLVGLFGLLQGLGIHILPFDFAQNSSFNTVGTAASLGIFMALVVTLAGGMLLSGHNKAEKVSKADLVLKVFTAITAILGLLIISALDYWPVTVSLLVASTLTIAYAFIHARSLKGLGGVLLPVAALIISLMLLFFRFPLSLGYPSEVMPSMKASANIATQTLRESAFFGSGPGTYIYDYAKHRAPEVNQTAFWNIRFDRGSTHFLTLLATVGLLGTLTWLMVSLFLLGSAGRKLLRADERTWHILIGVFSAWFMLMVSKFIYTSTFTLEFLFWLMMALLVVVHKHDFYSVRFERSPRAAMVVSFVFILGVVFSVSGLFVVGQRYMGEVYYSKALSADQTSGNIDQVLTDLSKAVNLNQKNDVYLRNLAVAVLGKANQLINEPLGLTQEEGESDEDFMTRQRTEAEGRLRAASQLTSEAVKIAKRAKDINPANVANWSVLGSVYRGLIGTTEGAAQWSMESYKQAIEREPSNPGLHTSVGELYMVQVNTAAAGLQTEDEEAKAAAQAEVDDLLAKAVDAFSKALELKPDHGPAHFSLALALDQQGKLEEAIQKMENVVMLNPRDVGVGFQLALLYYRNDQKDAAMRLLESVVQLSPKYANARWYLAVMYEEAGEKDLALEQLNALLETNPDNEVIQQKIDQLKRPAAPVDEEDDLPPPIDGRPVDEGQPAIGR